MNLWFWIAYFTFFLSNYSSKTICGTSEKKRSLFLKLGFCATHTHTQVNYQQVHYTYIISVYRILKEIFESWELVCILPEWSWEKSFVKPKSMVMFNHNRTCHIKTYSCRLYMSMPAILYHYVCGCVFTLLLIIYPHI